MQAATLVPLSSLSPDAALSLAKARLLRLNPFYGHLLAGTRHRFVPDLKSGLATTMDELGRFEILHNPVHWVMPDTPIQANGERVNLWDLPKPDRDAAEANLVPWTLIDLAGGLQHECDHIMHLHHVRGRGLDQELFGRCADVAINQNLPHLPSFAINERTYGLPPGLAAEAYYARLDKERQQGGPSPKAPGKGQQPPNKAPQPNPQPGPGKGQPTPSGTTPGGAPHCDNRHWKEVAGREGRYNRRVAALAQSAMAHAKRAGMPPGPLPAELAKLIEGTGRKARNWRHDLRAFFRANCPAGLRGTIMRCNRRGAEDQPGLQVKFRGSFAVIADTSASVSDDQLEQFLAELNAMAIDAEIIVLETDARVNCIRRHRRGATKTEFHGRGGTVFTEAFDAVSGRCKRAIPGLRMLRRLSGIIILTDGEVHVPERNPTPYRVMWALTKGGKRPCGWGQVCHIEDEAT